MRANPCHRSEAEAADCCRGGDDHRSRAVRDAGGVARVYRAIRPEHRRQSRHAVERSVKARMLVAIQGRRALPAFDGDSDDLVAEALLFPGATGLLLRFHRIPILLVARDLVSRLLRLL